MKRLIEWIQANKTEAVLVVIIIVAAAFLRLYKIDQYLTFLGDEGRDVIVVKKLISNGDLIFIGPTTSVGNMYLGPAYYYLMAPFLAIWQLSPVGPAVMVALLSTVTVFLIYYLGKKLFSTEVGIFAASLAAVSPAVILSSRSSWNPNPMPFFAILVVFSIYKLLKSQKPQWLLLTTASLAFALQMHYLGVLLTPLIIVFWLWHLITIRHTPYAIRSFLPWSLVACLLFLIIMSPLLIFDLNPQHRFLNFNAFKQFFLERAATEEHLATVNLNPVNALPRIFPLYFSFFERFITVDNNLLAKLLALSVFLTWISAQIKFLKDKRLALWLLAGWLIIGIVGLSLYQLKVFDHYFGFVVPAAFLLVGLFLALLYRSHITFKIVAIAIFALLIYLNLANTPLENPPNRQLQRTQELTRFIIGETSNQPFNFALIAQNNYDAAYQYYFDLFGYQPITIDNQNLEQTITDQLFIICEDTDCQPLGYSKWEVAGFGKAKGLAVIAQEWQVGGVKVYKLVHGQQLF